MQRNFTINRILGLVLLLAAASGCGAVSKPGTRVKAGASASSSSPILHPTPGIIVTPSTPSTIQPIGQAIRPFGTKAWAFATRPPQYDARINVLEGAVRSSKTWANIPKILQLCRYPVAGIKLITGVSKATIYNNILNDLFDIVGPSNYTYNRQSGELSLMGTKWVTMGAKDEGSERYVRGMTVGVAVGDELTLQPKSFVMMLMNRMSPEGARAYFTTNPDSPFHYVKTDILDHPGLRAKGWVWSEHFTLADNPNLTDDYKQFVASAYTGVYKLRYIDGLWVVAEGAIYKDAWSEDLLYDDEPWAMSDGRPGCVRPEGLYNYGQAGGYVERYIPVDCGVVHPQVYLDVLDDGDTMWFDREYWWDSTVQMQQKTDSEYADDLEEFLKPAPNAQTILPPECASFSAELTRRGIWHMEADNAVADGIKTVSSVLSRRKARFHRRRCVHTIQQMPAYAWDTKKANRGIEEPIKQLDDGPDCVRYGIQTKYQPWRLAA